MANAIGSLLNSISDPAQNPVVQLANQEVHALHEVVAGVGQAINLDGTVGGLTHTSETIGLGKIGGSNLITDTAQVPGDIINGANPVTVVSGIVTDAGESASAAGGILQGLGSDLSNSAILSEVGNVVSSVVNTATGALLGGLGGIGGGSEGSGEASVSASAAANAEAGDDHATSANAEAAGGSSLGSALQFPDLDGTGADSLTGITSSFLGTANPGEMSSDHASLDVHPDGPALLPVHDGLDSPLGLHDGAVI